MVTSEIFAVPVGNRVLLYSPLQGFAALLDRGAVYKVQHALAQADHTSLSDDLKFVVDRLQEPPLHVLAEKQGPIVSPLFLGLITTRNCNMGCVYCDFAAPKSKNAVMDLKTARSAINAYFDLLQRNGQHSAPIHFFGGEPFYARDVINFVISYATFQSQKMGLDVCFEVITNGLFSSEQARWIGSYFDTVILSLDGPSDIQDRNRPGLGGTGLFETVFRSAKILSDSSAELIIRSCITSDSVERIPAIAEWIARELRPSTWCIEPLTLCSSLPLVNMAPPDPWRFAVNYDIASQILTSYGIKLVNSTVTLGAPSLSCCPVGQDALIISPEGHIDSCYLLEKEWLSRGMNMRLGSLQNDDNGRRFEREREQSAEVAPTQSDVLESKARFQIAMDDLQRIRKLNVQGRQLCDDCLCRCSCGGGCYVNHETSRRAGEFDQLCIYTRLITVAKLLREMGQDNLVKELLASQRNMEVSVWRQTDRLFSQELEF